MRTSRLRIISLPSSWGLAAGITAPPPPPPGNDLCGFDLPAPVDDTTYNLPQGGTLWTPSTAVAFQNALDNASLGDVIQLNAGTVYAGPFTLPVKSGTGWIYIISSALASLPPAGTRVGPSNVSNMPTLRMTNAGISIFETAGAVHHYRFVGIHGDVSSSISTTFGRAAMVFGIDATTTGNQPHHITFDRCYFHGRDGSGPSDGLGMVRFLTLGGAHMAIIDSYVSEVHASGNDAQAVLVYNGSGPYKFHNCHLESSGENVMIGGANSQSAALLPSDITFTRNYFFKPLSWVGLGWGVKNLLELKVGVRVLIEGNVFRNSWAQAQAGWACVFWSATEDSAAPWTQTAHVTMRKNRITNVASLWQLTNGSSSGTWIPMNHVCIHDNVADHLNDVGGQSAALGGSVKQFQIKAVDYLSIQHNTTAVGGSSGVHSQENWVGGVSDQFVNKNNIYGISTYGVLGDADGLGSACYTTFTTSNRDIHRTLYTGDPSGSYPADCYYPANHAAIGFVNEAGGDFHLSGASAFKNTATDGTDPGADIDAVNAAIAGVED